MKYFISQPMRNLEKDEILRDRKLIIEKIKRIDEDAEIIDSFMEEAEKSKNPLWFLGMSIMNLSKADIIYMARGWDQARGCIIEKECAIKYGIRVIEE